MDKDFSLNLCYADLEDYLNKTIEIEVRQADKTHINLSGKLVKITLKSLHINANNTVKIFSYNQIISIQIK